MTKTLSLRLAGPLQSWGADSRFEVRRTQLLPTKSAVIGILASALGRPRDADISDLAGLKFGVRVDQPGTVMTDYQTVKGAKQSYVTNRQYLSDAKFIVALEGEDEKLMTDLEQALSRPANPLYLGRRSCPPDLPLNLGLSDLSLEKTLADIPWQGTDSAEPSKFHLFLEGGDGMNSRRIPDQPDSYDFHHRKYKSRVQSEKLVPNIRYEGREKEQDHDPFSILEDF